MMKKFLISIILMMLLTTSALASSTDGLIELYSVPKVIDDIGIQSGTEIVIGSVTSMNGTFGTDLWPASTTDLDVRQLLQGYATISWSLSQGMMLDSVAIAGVESEINLNGDYEFTLTVADNLKYNDGSPITAKDYVFSILLSGAAEISELGGTPQGYSHIAGYDSYISGKVDTLLGVRLLSERTFKIIVAKEHMPYFYGYAMLNVVPYPISIIAPGCDILDNGFGTYIAPATYASSMPPDPRGFTPGEFGVDMLRATMLDPVVGYVFAPRVTSGPYSFESFNLQTRTATFTANPYYIGNYEGQKPHIERIVIKQVFYDTMLEEILDKSVDILHKVTNHQVIDEGVKFAGEGLFQYMEYPRTGMAFLSLACEMGPTSSTAVRKAIAYCVDKDTLVEETVGKYGTVVHGYYGIGQWMTNAIFEADEEEGKEELDVQNVLAGLKMPFRTELAKNLLIEDGWVLNENGDDFDEEKDAMRYREEDGELVPLLIKWGKMAENEIANKVEALIVDTFAEVGMGLEITELRFHEMLEYYNRERERTYNMFYLASNFEYIFDPFYTFNTSDEYQGAINTTGIRDELLMERARAMRETSVSERREYTERWLAFQDRFVDVMPMVPLYSNMYFDFLPNNLDNYDIIEYSTWAEAILYASFSDVVDLSDEEQVDMMTGVETDAPAEEETAD